MRSSLRASMAVLHTWCGLIFGWVLFTVFLTGSLAIFWMQIGDWATPELFTRAAPTRAETILRGVAYLKRVAPASPSWRLVLPNERDRALGLAWETGPGDEMEKRTMDPATGHILRDTNGGWFFVHFHYRLNVTGSGRIGQWIVGVASVAMLVACLRARPKIELSDFSGL